MTMKNIYWPDGDADELLCRSRGLGATDETKIVLSQELEKMRKNKAVLVSV